MEAGGGADEVDVQCGAEQCVPMDWTTVTGSSSSSPAVAMHSGSGHTEGALSHRGMDPMHAVGPM